MRIAMYLKRPVFEIHSWPETELEYWSCYFSIDDDVKDPKRSKSTQLPQVPSDLPGRTKRKPTNAEIERSMAGFAAIFGGDDG